MIVIEVTSALIAILLNLWGYIKILKYFMPRTYDAWDRSGHETRREIIYDLKYVFWTVATVLALSAQLIAYSFIALGLEKLGLEFLAVSSVFVLTVLFAISVVYLLFSVRIKGLRTFILE